MASRLFPCTPILLLHCQLILLISISSLLLVGCGNSRPSLVGVWEELPGSGLMATGGTPGKKYQFFDDGRIEEVYKPDADSSRSSSGGKRSYNYKWLDSTLR